MKRRVLVICKRLAIALGICLGLIILLLGGLLVFLGTETGLQTAVSLATRFTDGRFTLEKASGSLYNQASLRGLRYVDTGLDLRLDELHLDWSPGQLWHQHLAIAEIRLAGLRLVAAGGQETPPSDEPFSLPVIDLPIRISLGRLEIDDFSLFSQQENADPDFQLQQGLIQDVNFQEQRLQVKKILVKNKEMLVQGQAEVQTIASYPLNITLQYHYEQKDLPKIRGQAKLTGTLSDLHLDNQLQAPAILSVQAQVLDALADLRWNLHLAGDVVELAKIQTDLPAVQISKLLLTGQGTNEEYSLNLQLNAVMQELGQEPLQLTTVLQGNLDGLSLKSLQLIRSKASLLGQGQVTWSPQLSWQMQVKADHLDPSFLLAEWPADINLNLQTKGQIQGEGLAGVQAEVQLAELSGNLRGYPLAGEGNIKLHDGQIHIPDFALRCAGTSLRLQGDYAEKANLRFDLVAPNLQALLPDFQGKVVAKGQLKGQPEQLEITLSVQADELNMAATGQIKKLRLDAKGELSAKSLPQLRLQAEQLQFGETLIDTLNLRLEGSVQANQLHLEVKSKELDLALGLQGEADLEKMAWTGKIHNTRIELPQLGVLQQKQASSLQLSADKVALAPFCLTMAEGSLCLDASWTDNIWQAHSKVDKLDLGILKKFPDIVVPPAIKKYGGVIVADANATGKNAEVQQAAVNLGLKDFFLVLMPGDQGQEQRLQWDNNQVQIHYANNTLSASLHSNLPQKAAVDFDLKLNKIDLAQPDQLLNLPVQGKLQLNVQDFTLINLLSEHMVNIVGPLQGTISLSNTLASPKVNGHIELADSGKAELIPLGITLSPLSLQVQSNAKELQVQGLVKSGQGDLRITTNLELQKLHLNTATITVKGENFQALHLPEMALVISPDLQITLKKEQLDVRGSVTVPSAKISSTIDTSNAITTSDDVVVIDDEKSRAAGPSLPLYLRVKVILGEDVRVDAYGLRGRIVGNLELSGEPKRPLLGTGTLQVKEGLFTFMGQKLGLDLSRLLFTGGPLDNPGVDLRVETNAGKTKAGLTVQGTLRRQEVNLYSTPTMDQFTILRHLLEKGAIGGETREDVGVIGDVADKAGMGGAVPYLQALKKFSMVDEIRLDTGDDFDDAALVFGSWVTPDFYISYGKSLMDDTSSFNTRYTVGKGFFLTTNASASASGGDVKYELER